MKFCLDRLIVERTENGLRWDWYVKGFKEPIISGCEPSADSIEFNNLPASIDIGEMNLKSVLHPGLFDVVVKAKND